MLLHLNQFAQDTMLISSDPTVTSASSDSSSPVTWVIAIIIAIIIIVAHWKIFTKAGKPGWASIIPIYNTIVLLEIIGRPIWWFILLFIPLVNIVILVIISIDLAKAFGKGAGYALLLIFLPFIGFPMLAFGNATYKKPSPAKLA